MTSAEEALGVCHEENPERAEYFSSEGRKFWDQFDETKQLQYLDEAIRCYRLALLSTLSIRERSNILNKLGLAFEARFKKTQQLDDIEQSTHYHRKILEENEGKGVDCYNDVYNIGNNFQHRFSKTSHIFDLEQAIQHHQQALKATPVDDLEACSISFYKLGSLFQQLFTASGHVEDLKQSIRYHEQALHGLGAGTVEFAKCFGMLGVAFGNLSDKEHDLEALGRSIWYYRQALKALPKEHPDRLICMGNLGVAYGDRFQRTSRRSDLDRFIAYMQRAYAATPINNSIQRAQYLGSLGAGLGNRFQQTGQMTDLEQSIQYYQQALTVTPRDDPQYVQHLSNLGVGFAERYRRTFHTADIEHCLQCHQQVLELTSADDHRYGTFLNNLGVAYGDRFQRMNQMADLDQSITYHEQAVNILPTNHWARPRHLAILGLRFGARYRDTHNLTDLEQSVKYAHQAVESLPAGHLDRAEASCVLGLALRDRFEKWGRLEDMDKSIEYLQQAIESTPEDHPQSTRQLFVLGAGLAARSRRIASSKDFKNSTQAFRMALSRSFGVPFIRVGAGLFAVDNLSEEGDWKEAAATLGDVLQLLPEVTLPTSSRDDMQNLLGALSGLASLSASVYLKAGKHPLEALQALEKARGVIASFLIDARSDVSILKENHPELWSRYDRCQREIAAREKELMSALTSDSPQNYAVKSSQRQQLYQALHQLRDEIRQCPGFERFLLSITEEEIRSLAVTGPVICFNVSIISSEAFIITTMGIHVLPLLNLKADIVRRQVRIFASRGNPARRDATLCKDSEDDIPPVPHLPSELRSIWDNAVEPVLRQVGLLEQDRCPSELPRIWWVGGGLMALLPLHAAGDHARGSLENTLSHVVSSFAPTLRSLQLIRTRPPLPVREKKLEFLLVSMPTTPGGYKSLDVVEEVASIMKYSGSVASIKHLERPTREAVLHALESCDIAHFACHGSVNGAEPTKSALIVGQDIEERLTIADLDTVSRKNAQIVYLSACSTAEIQALTLVHESIHLANAFQLSGFQHVIGTLWGADDGAAVKIASEFYRVLLQRAEVGELHVARALHDAVLSFRNTGNNHEAVSLWAPFIHLGC